MNARAEIFSRIRAAAQDGAVDRRAAAKRLQEQPVGVVPARPASADRIVAAFVEKAVAAAASVEQIRAGSEAQAIAAYLRSHNLPQELRLGSDPRLARIEWPRHGAPLRRMGPSDGNDITGLSHAAGAIGETGTLVVVSGPRNPTTVNFLPENHIVIVDRRDIVHDQETIWSRLRSQSPHEMPRTVNMITGPSRSADIEQTLILGAHGPMRLHILVVSKDD